MQLVALQPATVRALAAAAPSGGAAAPHHALPAPLRCPQRPRRSIVTSAAAAAPARPAAEGGHTALLHGLGEVGDVAPVHLPWLLRLAHIKSRITGGDSNAALQESARGLLMWKVSRHHGEGEGRALAVLAGACKARTHACVPRSPPTPPIPGLVPLASPPVSGVAGAGAGAGRPHDSAGAEERRPGGCWPPLLHCTCRPRGLHAPCAPQKSAWDLPCTVLH